jgi:hypothetical protein
MINRIRERIERTPTASRPPLASSQGLLAEIVSHPNNT